MNGARRRRIAGGRARGAWGAWLMGAALLTLGACNMQDTADVIDSPDASRTLGLPQPTRTQYPAYPPSQPYPSYPPETHQTYPPPEAHPTYPPPPTYPPYPPPRAGGVHEYPGCDSNARPLVSKTNALSN